MCPHCGMKVSLPRNNPPAGNPYGDGIGQMGAPQTAGYGAAYPQQSSNTGTTLLIIFAVIVGCIILMALTCGFGAYYFVASAKRQVNEHSAEFEKTMADMEKAIEEENRSFAKRQAKLSRPNSNTNNSTVTKNYGNSSSKRPEVEIGLPGSSTNKRPNSSSVTKRKPPKVGPKPWIDTSDLFIGRISGIRWGAKGLDVAVSADRTFLVVARFDQHIEVYDWTTRTQLSQRKIEDVGNANSLVVTPDGKFALYGGTKGTIPVYEIEDDGTLELAESYVGHTTEIKFIDIGSDSKTVLSASTRNKTVRIWDLKTGKEKNAIEGFDRAPIAGRLSEDCKSAFVFDGVSVYTVNLESESVEKIKEITRSSSSECCFSPDAKLMAIRKGVKDMLIYDENFNEVASFKGDHFPRHLKFSPDNSQLYFGTHGKAHVYNLKTKNLRSFSIDPTFGLEGIAFSPDGNQCAMATGSSGGKIVIAKTPQ